MRTERHRFSLRRFLGKSHRSVSRPDSYTKPPKGHLPLTKSQFENHSFGMMLPEPPRVYPQLPSEVLSVSVRLRGDFAGMILTTTVTFHAFDGLKNQVSAALTRHFGPGAIGIATPRGTVITEDYQISQLQYPSYSYTFCNVVYDPARQRDHPPITIPSQKVLVEVSEDDVVLDTGDRIRYIYPGHRYSTTYSNSPGLSATSPHAHGHQRELAIQRGDYVSWDVGLPPYDCVPTQSSGNTHHACFACICCRGWMAHALGERAGRWLERMASMGMPRPTPTASPSRVHLWPQRNQRQLQVRDFDGLNLEQRRRLVRARGARVASF